MSKTFKDAWKTLGKSHDIDAQEKLDEVKEEVHEMDEQLDSIEEESKPGAESEKSVDNTTARNEHYEETKKNTVHVTYDKNGVPTNSYVDEEEHAEKDMTNGEKDDPHETKEKKVEKHGESIHTKEWDDCIRDVQSKDGNHKANAYAVCTAKLGEQSFKSQYRHMAYIKSLVTKAVKEVHKMGIGAAGPVPSSLLARQDLQGEAYEEEARVQAAKDKLHEN